MFRNLSKLSVANVMNVDWKFVLGRVAKWPAQDQKKLAEIVDMIEAQNKTPAGEASGGAGARASNWIASTLRRVRERSCPAGRECCA